VDLVAFRGFGHLFVNVAVIPFTQVDYATAKDVHVVACSEKLRQAHEMRSFFRRFFNESHGLCGVGFDISQTGIHLHDSCIDPLLHKGAPPCRCFDAYFDRRFGITEAKEVTFPVTALFSFRPFVLLKNSFRMKKQVSFYREGCRIARSELGIRLRGLVYTGRHAPAAKKF
jgi:hypothetical protein